MSSKKDIPKISDYHECTSKETIIKDRNELLKKMDQLPQALDEAGQSALLRNCVITQWKSYYELNLYIIIL